MRRRILWLILCLAGLFLAACNGGVDNGVEMLRVSPDEFVISLIAKGELRAAESTPIRPPQGSHDPRTISSSAKGVPVCPVQRFPRSC